MRQPLLYAIIALLLTACQGEAERLYAPHRAFLRFQPVTAAPPLFKAVGNVGHWCTITYDHRNYTFAAPAQASTTYPLTALTAYGAPISIAGFIVGTPQLPDIDGQQSLRAYDLVCPSCYESTLIARSLQLGSVGSDRAHCPHCRRQYDLSTAAPLNAPDDGQPNSRLYRYRISYAVVQSVLVVQN